MRQGNKKMSRTNHKILEKKEKKRKDTIAVLE